MTDKTNLKPHAPEDGTESTNADGSAFWSVLQRRLSRRWLLRNGTVMSAAAILPILPFQTCDDLPGHGGGAAKLKFSPVPKGLQDHVVVPAGYTAHVLTAVGDPIDQYTSANANDGTAQDFARRVGDHGDALAYFSLPRGSHDSSDGLLVQNHEAVTDVYLHANGATNDPYVDKSATQPRPLSEVLKEQEAHGISVLRIAKNRSGKWYVDRRYRGNSRWHVNTEMVLSGPAAGSEQVVTKLSPRGDRCFGTLNNCGHGLTPWGTYLSGEENWAFTSRVAMTRPPILCEMRGCRARGSAPTT